MEFAIIGRMSENRLSETDRLQRRIGPYIDALLAACEASPTTHTGAALDAERRELVLYGVGHPPAVIVGLMAEAPAGLNVQWRSAPYTRDELAAESERIMAAFSTLHTGGPRTDGTALEFTTADTELLAADDPQRALGSRYPVAISRGERPSLY